VARFREFLVALLLFGVACRPAPPPRQYHVIGQIVAIDPTRQLVTIKHGDIQGFMPAMTMPFRVKDPSITKGRAVGQLVDATLLVQGTDAWLERIDVTGTAPVPAGAAPEPRLGPGDKVPDATFTDQSGREFRLSSFSGRPLVLSFLYTRCPLPEYCPAIESRLAGVQQRIAGDPTLAGTMIVAVTIDPEHDTPPVLQARAKERRADPAIWKYATGPIDAIDRFGRRFGLSVSRSGGEIDHNLRTIVLDGSRTIVAVETGADWTVDALMTAVRRAKTAS
jgi:protein SCO1